MQWYRERWTRKVDKGERERERGRERERERKKGEKEEEEEERGREREEEEEEDGGRVYPNHLIPICSSSGERYTTGSQ